jgi:osmotically-inducible protein OsmY
MRNSYRYPGQAALVARLPVVGRRVPMRAYWKRQPLKPAMTAERYMTNLFGGPSMLVGVCGGLFGGRVTDQIERFWPGVRIEAEERGRGTLETARHYLPHGVHLPEGLAFDGNRLREQIGERAGSIGLPQFKRPSTSMPGARSLRAPARMRRARFSGRMHSMYPGLLVGAAAGALAMYYMDPNQGRRRRALVRDKMAHFKNVMTRSVPERAGKRARFFGGVAKGVGHNAMELVRPENGRYEDDETLVARVRSEVLRHPRFKPGEIHLDAYEGCVTLRGQLDDPQDIRKLVSDTKHVEGVREVRSYLHLPDSPPPNKAEVYRASEQHMPAI